MNKFAVLLGALACGALVLGVVASEFNEDRQVRDSMSRAFQESRSFFAKKEAGTDAPFPVSIRSRKYQRALGVFQQLVEAEQAAKLKSSYDRDAPTLKAASPRKQTIGGLANPMNLVSVSA